MMVHDIKPPFLDGRLVLSTQSQPVVPVRGPTPNPNPIGTASTPNPNPIGTASTLALTL